MQEYRDHCHSITDWSETGKTNRKGVDIWVCDRCGLRRAFEIQILGPDHDDGMVIDSPKSSRRGK